MRISIVEDDSLLGDSLRSGLRQRGFQVDWVQDDAAGESELRAHCDSDAVVDLGLPRKGGINVLTCVRRTGLTLPILLLKARDVVTDRIRGLAAGADDDIPKPLDLDELAAWLRALVRRAHGQPQERLVVQDLVLGPAARSDSLAGKPVVLSLCEFDLLHALMLNAGCVLSLEQLEQHLYSWGQEVESNAVEVHVHHLRRKLAPDLIVTVRGVGYLMRRDATS